jgi:hypothetical protein
MYQHYLGVDLHRRRSYVVLMGNQGKLIDQRRLPNDAIPDYVAQLPKSTFAVLETTGNWSSMYDVFEKGTDEFDLAHPKTCQSDSDRKDQNR